MAERKLICDLCGLPYARLTNGCVMIQSIHHGDKHLNVISVAELMRLVEQDEGGQELLLLSLPVPEVESV